MKVTLLTQENCDFCDQAKDLLHRLGPEFGLEVKLIDVSTDRGRSLAKSGGVLFPPGVLLDGQAFSYGRLSERRLRRELKRRAPDR